MAALLALPVMLVAKALRACVLAFLAASLLPWLRDVWRTRHFPPFVPSPPFIGDFPELGAKGLHRLLADRAERYLKTYPAFRVFVGSQVWVVTADPESARRQLSRLIQRNKFVPITKNETSIGGGRDLVSLSGERWRRMRLAWQPAFSPASLARYAPLMDGLAKSLADKLEPYGESGEAVDVVPFTDALTLDVVGTTAFGVRFNALATEGGKPPPSETPSAAMKRQAQGSDNNNDNNNENVDADALDALDGRRLVEAARTIFRCASLVGIGYQALIMVFPLGVPLWRLLARYFPDANLRELNAAQRVVDEVSTALVRRQHRREDRAKAASGADAPSSSAPVSTRLAAGVIPGSFLSQLLRPAPVPRGSEEAPPPLDETDAVAQAGLFVLAGAETTSSAVACCVYALSTSPAAQRRLHAEIDAFFAERGRDAELTPDAVAASFPFAEGAVKEALRYYTPVTNIPREVTALPENPNPHTPRSDLLAAPSFSLHPGIVVVAANYVYQRSADYWPRADEFLPERWVPEERGGAASVLGATTPWAWTPFGGGPRQCVGLKFAMLEATIVIVRLLQRFEFAPAPAQKIPLPMKQTVTHAPDGGVNVVVKRRQAR